MGIKNFIKFIEKFAPSAISYKRIEDYKDKIIGIDANLLIYKLIYAIRARGYDIKNNKIIVTHIHTLLLKLTAFRKYNIIPIFVFDSIPPKIKHETLKIREDIKKKLINKYKKSKTKSGKRIYYYVSSYITDKEIKEFRKLINIFNYTIIDSKEEADSQLASLYKNKIIDYIASDDMDILLFGGGILLKNFTIDKTKKIQEINLKKILQEANITMNQLIEIGILMGTDYCANKSISANKAFNIIKKYNNIYKIPSNIIKINCNDAINYYKNPPIKKINKIDKQTNISINELQIFLQSFEFNNEYIKKIRKKIKKFIRKS